MSPLVAQLAELGLTKNEALAYLTLLADDGGSGLTGYEVAARSGVPRSAVYGVVRKLAAAGAAFSAGTDPVRFVAVDPDQWVEQVRRNTIATLDEVRTALHSLPKRERPEPVWILRDYDEVMQRIERMIRSATSSVYLSLWPRELELVRDALGSVEVHRVLHSPAAVEPPADVDAWIDDVASIDEAKTLWSHKALVVVDRREALLGGTEPGADNHAVWTTNPSLVDTATNHIVLDITLMARARGIDPEDTVAPMMRPHL